MESFDGKAKKWQLESFPVNLKLSPDVKTNIAVVAADTSITLYLTGSGIGTSTVDMGSKLVFVLDNDSAVVAVSPEIQGINFDNLVSSYRHYYHLSLAGLQALSRHQLKLLRKFSAGGVDVIPIEKKNATKVKEVSGLLFAKLKEKKLIPEIPLFLPAGFPGGIESLARFINRNLRQSSDLQNGEKRSTIAIFYIAANGTVNDIQLGTSLGATLDDELTRIFKRMPKWKPALENGKPISFKAIQPLSLRRNGDSLQVELL